MKLYNRENQTEFEAKIEKVNVKELKTIYKSKRFGFDWRLEKKLEVYKIIDEETEEIHGLMSLNDYPHEFRIHLNLIEIPLNNQGKLKTIDWAAGCLLAFASQLAFKNDYNGFVSLHPKTKLIKLYTNDYGFSHYGRFLGIEGTQANELISKYL